MFDGEALRAFGDQHHVRAIFEDFARELNGMLDAMEIGGGAGAKCGAVHDDGVAFDMAVEVEVRAVAGVEDGVIFEDDDGGFDGVEGGTAAGEDGPAGGESAVAAGIAGFHGFVRDIPCAAVNDEGRWHEQRIAEKREKGKWKNEIRKCKAEA